MSWIQTHSGRRFDLLSPTPEMVDLDDIATALSNLCRFTGHMRHFYSVAQHSVFVSTLVPRKHALVALLHDATEAYVGDMARPLKALLPDYKLIEARVWRAIAQRFDLPAKLPFDVKLADNIALVTERRDLLNPCQLRWDEGIEAVPPHPSRITALLASEARAQFLDRYMGLTEAASS